MLKEVKIKVLMVGQASTQSTDLSVFKVGVNDKVIKLLAIFQETEQQSGYFIFNGKIVLNPDEVTFSKLSAGNMA